MDVDIPGCADVVHVNEQERINFAFGGGGGLGNVDVPWATQAGADAMSDALIAALPSDSVVEDDYSESGLKFVSPARAADESSFGEDTATFGTIALDERTGDVTASAGREL